ncbi:MAG: DUF2793 domain-containing protein, partial [Planctomycetota bacterium]
RTGHTAVWNGIQMLVWGGYNGGYLDTGGVYRPTGDYWTVMTTTAETPAGREGHTAVWTGTEMIIWGGQNGPNSSDYLDDGGRYNPNTDSWTYLPAPMIGPPISREFHTMVFSAYNWQVPVITSGITTPPPAPALNDRYLISPTGATGAWAGYENNLTVCTNETIPTWEFTTPVAGMYVFSKNENRVYKYNGTGWIATTARSQVLIWGGWNGVQAFRNGSRYNPIDDNWTLLRNSGSPTARYGHTAVWTYPISAMMTPTMITWGGFDGTLYTDTGGRYDPAIGRGGLWYGLPTAGALSRRAWHSAIWAYDGTNDSNEMVVWGGYDGSNYFNDGAIYELSSDAWYPMTSTNRPDVRMNHIAVWANTITPMTMVVWGGQSSNNNRLNTGGRYIPISDTWLSTSTPPLGFVGRDGHTAAWTGTGPEEGWTTYNIVTSNDIGLHTAIALSPSGRAHIAYYDYTYSDLKYTTNENGAWDSVGVSVDTTGKVGEYASIAIDSNGRFHISYYDRTNANLKYAIQSATGTYLAPVSSTDSASSVGEYTDIAIGPGNLAHISYYDNTNQNLKYTIRSVTGEYLAPMTVDSGGWVGKYTSIAVDNLNKAYISYYDETNGNLKYATVEAGAPTVTLVDGAIADVGLYSSIGIDATNNVYIAYYDISNGRLKFASNVTGVFVIDNDVTTIDSTTADHGEYCSLSVNTVSTDTVHVSYYDRTNMRLKYVEKETLTTTWSAPVIV